MTPETIKVAKQLAEEATWKQSDIYLTIANRLRTRHKIVIDDHIQTLKKVGRHTGEGIYFIPKDHKKLKALLTMPGFAQDDRRHFCDAVAASATNGTGYREIGTPSLHCQIGVAYCNIHIDAYGFVAIGPDGKKYYNPDLVQHIVDELGWETVVAWVHKKNPTMGSALGRVRPILPNSRNGYDLAVGAKIELKKGKGWGLSIDYTKDLTGNKAHNVSGNVDVLRW